MYVAPKLQGGSDLLLGPSLLPLTPGCLHILMDVCQQLVLPNQIWVCLSDVQQSPSADTRLWWRKVQCLLKGAKQANGRQASDPLPLGLWVKVFLKGKNKEVEVNHGLVTFLNHRSQDVSGLRSQAKWSMAWGSVSSSCPGETTWVCTLMMMATAAILVH